MIVLFGFTVGLKLEKIFKKGCFWDPA